MIRVLRRGCKGPDVLEVQKALNRRIAAGLDPDSDFGGATEGAVMAFQSAYRLEDDGIVGSQTRSVLFPLAGVTIHIVGAYGRGDMPVGSPAIASNLPQFNAARKRAEAGRLIASAGNFMPVGDVPDSDPSAPVIPDFLLKLVPPDTDPGGSTTLDNFRLPNGMMLPIPPILTAPLLAIPGVRFDSQQLQPGASFNTKPLFQSRAGTTNPAGGFVLAFQSVLARKKDEPGHLEVAEGFQLGKNLVAHAKDGTDWTLQWFIQATWVDPFWRRGRWHLVQPFVQINAQTDLKQSGNTVGGGLFPVNIAFEVVQDKVQIFGQAGGVVSWDLTNQRVEIGTQAVAGVNITLGAF